MKGPGLYVHIPFCIAKCDYCDFFSVPCSSISSEYIDAVINETLWLKEKYDISYWKTVYIGGGTPGLLNENQIEKLCSALIPEDRSLVEEVTIEVNPETVTESLLRTYEKCGITRLSMGVQSLNDEALKTVNRHCNSAAVRKAVTLLKKYWKGLLNFDLIAGLPGLSDSDFLEGVKEIASTGCGHISMYTLTVEEGTPLYRRIENGLEFDSDAADSQWLKGRELLEQEGFVQYEVSNFARSGYESRHNMIYWMSGDYGGAGSGACGTFHGKNGLRYTNIKDISKYIEFWTSEQKDKNPESVREIEILDEETQEFEFLMMGLRTVKGVSEAEYRKRFSGTGPWYGNLEERLKPVCQIKIRNEGNSRWFYLDKDGLLFLNSVLLKILD